MKKEKFKKVLRNEGISYKEKNGAIIITHGGSADLGSLFATTSRMKM